MQNVKSGSRTTSAFYTILIIATVGTAGSVAGYYIGQNNNMALPSSRLMTEEETQQALSNEGIMNHIFDPTSYVGSVTKVEVAATGNDVLMTWETIDGTNHHWYMATSHDGGKTYSEVMDRRPTTSINYNPIIQEAYAQTPEIQSATCMDNGLATSAWTEQNPQTKRVELYGSWSFDNGVSFVTSRLSNMNPSADVIEGSYSIPQGNCHVVGYLMHDDMLARNIVVAHRW